MWWSNCDNALLKNHILEESMLEGYKIYAADVDIDEGAPQEEMIDVSDQKKILDYILEKINSLNE